MVGRSNEAPYVKLELRDAEVLVEELGRLRSALQAVERLERVLREGVAKTQGIVQRRQAVPPKAVGVIGT